MHELYFLSLCKMSHINSTNYTILLRKGCACRLSKWAFSWGFISLLLQNETEILQLNGDSSPSALTAGATGEAWRYSVLIAHRTGRALTQNVPRKREHFKVCRKDGNKIGAGTTETGWWGRSRDIQPGKTGDRTVQVWPDLSCLSRHWWGPWGPHCGPRLLIMTSVWPWDCREVLTGLPPLSARCQSA